MTSSRWSAYISLHFLSTIYFGRKEEEMTMMSHDNDKLRETFPSSLQFWWTRWSSSSWLLHLFLFVFIHWRLPLKTHMKRPFVMRAYLSIHPNHPRHQHDHHPLIPSPATSGRRMNFWGFSHSISLENTCSLFSASISPHFLFSILSLFFCSPRIVKKGRWKSSSLSSFSSPPFFSAFSSSQQTSCFESSLLSGWGVALP